MKKIGIISCTKSKYNEEGMYAKDIYMKSTMFKYARKYVEENCDDFYILSAKHGLLNKDKKISPYDTTLNKMKKVEKEKWCEMVKYQMDFEFNENIELTLILGENYRYGLNEYIASKFKIKDINKIIKEWKPQYNGSLGVCLQWLKANTQSSFH